MAKPIGPIICLFGVLLLAGCKGMFGPQGMPADPLFSNGSVAESKAITGPAVAPPFSEPTPPINRIHIVQTGSGSAPPRQASAR